MPMLRPLARPLSIPGRTTNHCKTHFSAYSGWSKPLDRLTGEPLIYVSMGTVMNGRADVFRMIAAGVAKHKETQLVLSIGDRLNPKEIGPVPSNAIVVNHAPQLELLKRSSVCITHAGLNTVLECGSNASSHRR